ncbi:hypothetical protein PORCRE_1927 [Porphyromonas crevioricanis JCM 15906]|uniref:Uncharacterized protein n=1 Tax=Porphyromonas crevioricanis JCM 15906 TaxID=1305617 RepID=T1DU28_9PORP|nr:hypothetical protein PORCRE_1927 [Porphyromonas crevioricanis JCM 15906]
MAELVDALVSNTNDSNIVPVRSRLRARLKRLPFQHRKGSLFVTFYHILRHTLKEFFFRPLCTVSFFTSSASRLSGYSFVNSSILFWSF